MYLPIQPERLYERIVNQIEGCIVAGEWKAGDLLPSENELAKQLAVSRTAASEAIKALREKPLVEVRPGRGTFITDGMPDAIRHSPGFLMKFGSVNGLSNVVEVREAVEIMDTALDNMDVFVEADLDFHLALAEAT